MSTLPLISSSCTNHLCSIDRSKEQFCHQHRMDPTWNRSFTPSVTMSFARSLVFLNVRPSCCTSQPSLITMFCHVNTSFSFDGEVCRVPRLRSSLICHFIWFLTARRIGIAGEILFKYSIVAPGPNERYVTCHLYPEISSTLSGKLHSVAEVTFISFMFCSWA